MPKSFSLWPPNNTGAIIRMAVVVLAVANLVALYFVFRPVGGSPQDLQEQVAELRVQMRQRQGHGGADAQAGCRRSKPAAMRATSFWSEYFLPRRAAYPEVLAELNKLATEANIRPKESAFATEPIEGSDTLSMMQISANYEGNYGDLIRFINLLDKSENLLIVEGLNATPQQGSKLLNVVSSWTLSSARMATDEREIHGRGRGAEEADRPGSAGGDRGILLLLERLGWAGGQRRRSSPPPARRHPAPSRCARRRCRMCLAAGDCSAGRAAIRWSSGLP